MENPIIKEKANSQAFADKTNDHAAGKTGAGSPELPYERFLQYGGSVLTDAELIAIILRSGTKRAPVMQIAREVVTAGDHGNGSLSSLYALDLDDLMKIDGIGEVQAVKLLCILELSKRLAEQKVRPQVIYSDADMVARCYMERMRHLSHEEVLLICLDGKLGFLCDCTLTKGTVDASLLSSRTVFMEAIRHSAVNIILMHNHPSGDPTPSGADIDITRKIARTGKDLGICLADHIIIGDCQYCSMKEQGLIPI